VTIGVAIGVTIGGLTNVTAGEATGGRLNTAGGLTIMVIL
jgi:hypothetical protein